ncbi:unnamed protein product [Paramecium octaurelia]|uniref:Uncharacterized protein n=1 Tax=Paramecium octaurelia TaxID=43137 RepID=A0A8S1TT14_PAROT|nr:unnamed protein product [Paramecium octaurelia]
MIEVCILLKFNIFTFMFNSWILKVKQIRNNLQNFSMCSNDMEYDQIHIQFTKQDVIKACLNHFELFAMIQPNSKIISDLYQ